MQPGSKTLFCMKAPIASSDFSAYVSDRSYLGFKF